MRSNIILAAVILIAASSVVTAVGMTWLCSRVKLWLPRLYVSPADRDEAHTARLVTITDALVRIEDAATAASREAALAARDASAAVAKLSTGVDIGNELGFRNVQGQHRMERADAHVAGELADSIARADALPKDGNYGAAADAALRSATEGTLEE